MRISDWSSDVCSSDLLVAEAEELDDRLVVLVAKLEILLPAPSVDEPHALLSDANPRRSRQSAETGVDELMIFGVDVDRAEAGGAAKWEADVVFGVVRKPQLLDRQRGHGRYVGLPLVDEGSL